MTVAMRDAFQPPRTSGGSSRHTTTPDDRYFGQWDGSGWDGGDPPHLLWPADHAWFAAKDVDPDRIGVGGTQALIDEVVAAPELDGAPSAYDSSDRESR